MSLKYAWRSAGPDQLSLIPLAGALSLAGGLLGAAILALYFVPCIFLLIHKKSRQC